MDTLGGSAPQNGTLSTTPDTSTQTTITATHNGDNFLMGTFVTPADFLKSTIIIPGMWDMALYSYSNSPNHISFYFDLYSVDADGISNETMIVQGVSTSATVIGNVQEEYKNSIYVPLTILSDLTKRLRIRLYANFKSNRTLTIEFRNSTISHMHTSLEVVVPEGATGPTGPTGQGSPGDRGATGDVGNGISNSSIDLNGDLIFEYTNLTIGNAGRVVGPAGPTGPTGTFNFQVDATTILYSPDGISVTGSSELIYESGMLQIPNGGTNSQYVSLNSNITNPALIVNSLWYNSATDSLMIDGKKILTETGAVVRTLESLHYDEPLEILTGLTQGEQVTITTDSNGGVYINNSATGTGVDSPSSIVVFANNTIVTREPAVLVSGEQTHTVAVYNGYEYDVYPSGVYRYNISSTATNQETFQNPTYATPSHSRYGNFVLYGLNSATNEISDDSSSIYNTKGIGSITSISINPINDNLYTIDEGMLKVVNVTTRKSNGYITNYTKGIPYKQIAINHQMILFWYSNFQIYATDLNTNTTSSVISGPDTIKGINVDENNNLYYCSSGKLFKCVYNIGTRTDTNITLNQLSSQNDILPGITGSTGTDYTSVTIDDKGQYFICMSGKNEIIRLDNAYTQTISQVSSNLLNKRIYSILSWEGNVWAACEDGVYALATANDSTLVESLGTNPICMIIPEISYNMDNSDPLIYSLDYSTNAFFSNKSDVITYEGKTYPNISFLGGVFNVSQGEQVMPSVGRLYSIAYNDVDQSVYSIDSTNGNVINLRTGQIKGNVFGYYASNIPTPATTSIVIKENMLLWTNKTKLYAMNLESGVFGEIFSSNMTMYGLAYSSLLERTIGGVDWETSGIFTIGKTPSGFKPYLFKNKTV